MELKTAIRAGLCLILTIAAAVLSWSTLRSIRETPRTLSGEYLLGVSDGSVAVYDRADPTRPLEVTEIELDSLRAGDRELLREGLPVESREELLRLLEDLGS